MIFFFHSASVLYLLPWQHAGLEKTALVFLTLCGNTEMGL